MFEGFTQRTIDTGEVEINLRLKGDGPPLLLLHGYPQTHVMWHRLAPTLAEDFTVVCPDLRGYGDSAKPAGGPDHSAYAKRAMARDQLAVMAALGFDRFAVAGHDRGARVVHRLCLDHPRRVTRAAVLDIVPTFDAFTTIDQTMATAYYHWFFLIQGGGLPEHLIGLDPDYYLRDKLRRWSRIEDAFPPEVVAEYLRCFRRPETIHANCEDYRAAAGIDLEHDGADRQRLIECPLLVLWGGRGFVGRHYDVLSLWRPRARQVEGRALDCGHFLPEEAPAATLEALLNFFRT
ncbi:MAG: alpha/beta hydrolase [Candidatus Competibacteraceae bacterium]|nr:alpha/beta hydrolase [Candidatus Competibacteraceae bacterium]